VIIFLLGFIQTVVIATGGWMVHRLDAAGSERAVIMQRVSAVEVQYVEIQRSLTRIERQLEILQQRSK